jgi:hypothetical protein
VIWGKTNKDTLESIVKPPNPPLRIATSSSDTDLLLFIYVLRVAYTDRAQKPENGKGRRVKWSPYVTSLPTLPSGEKGGLPGGTWNADATLSTRPQALEKRHDDAFLFPLPVRHDSSLPVM